MVQSLRHSRLPTHNRTGWTSTQLNEVSELFVAFSRRATHPVLDIGAAFGIASLAALDVGATVFANDIEADHLAAIAAGASPESSHRLTIVPGRFPEAVDFPDASLAAVHASNVLHFLTGLEIETGLRAVARWLIPGGKLFVQASTPWQQPFQAFVPVFEARRDSGVEWPGWIERTRTYSTHRKLGQIPPSIHLLDSDTLRGAAERAGLTVESAWLYRRRDLPASLFLDGRECAGLIASKPKGIP